MIRNMLGLILLFLFFLPACTTLEKVQQSPSIPVHPCLKAAADNNRDYIEKNFQICRDIKSSNGVTILMMAASKGHSSLVAALVGLGMDVNALDQSYDSALSYAVVFNRLETVNFLVLSGAQLSTRDPSGVTLLMRAVQSGSPQMIQALSLTRQSINDQAVDGWTALYFAIRRQDASILSWLLRQGACKDMVDQEKISPHDFAREVGWAEGEALLAKAPACRKNRKKGTLNFKSSPVFEAYTLVQHRD